MLLPENVKLSNSEILHLLNVDTYISYSYSVAGTIIGTVKGWNCLDLLDRATKDINSMFCCFDNRVYKTVLDKKYSKDELFVIATTNDRSGGDFWRREIDSKYPTYIKAFDIYQKFKEQL
jgi:hypothetical protein